MLRRTENRTRDSIYCQTMRTVRDISRDDRAILATCSLRTPAERQTGRLKENYSIDNYHISSDCYVCIPVHLHVGNHGNQIWYATNRTRIRVESRALKMFVLFDLPLYYVCNIIRTLAS